MVELLLAKHDCLLPDFGIVCFEISSKPNKSVLVSMIASSLLDISSRTDCRTADQRFQVSEKDIRHDCFVFWSSSEEEHWLGMSPMEIYRRRVEQDRGDGTMISLAEWCSPSSSTVLVLLGRAATSSVIALKE